VFLLDTDTVIYALRGNREIDDHLVFHRDDPLKLSAITLLELYYGAHKSKDPVGNSMRLRRLEAAFEVLPVASELSEGFGRLKAGLEREGTPLDDFDLIIAATALAYNLVLVTNNERHFRRVEGLRIENWTLPPAKQS